jgi:hypothetical protein
MCLRHPSKNMKVRNNVSNSGQIQDSGFECRVKQLNERTSYLLALSRSRASIEAILLVPRVLCTCAGLWSRYSDAHQSYLP